MKRGTILGLTAAGLTLVLLMGLAAYLWVCFAPSKIETETAQIESEADLALSWLKIPAVEAQTAEAEAERQTEKTDTVPWIWVGDSRTVGMQKAMQNEDCYIAAAGEGYEWSQADGLPLLKEALLQHPAASVIFNLGVNDYENLDNYLALYRQILAEYPDVRFYFLSVNPVDSEQCLYITNEEISGFNNCLKQVFPDTYIDSYTWMLSEDIRPFDGIHYEKDAYRSLYAYTTGQIQCLNN